MSEVVLSIARISANYIQVASITTCEGREHHSVQVVEAVSAGCADAFEIGSVADAFEGGFYDRLLWGVGSCG